MDVQICSVKAMSQAGNTSKRDNDNINRGRNKRNLYCRLKL